MADTVTIAWTDSKGTFTSSFLIENPTLDEVRSAYSGFMLMPMPAGDTPSETDEEFYARISLQMVTQVMGMAQQHKTQQAMNLIPPVSIKPVEPPA